MALISCAMKKPATTRACTEPPAPTPKKRIGRPPVHTEATRQAILDRLKNGEALRAICRTPGMPGVGTVMDWAENEPLFAERYARARERGYDVRAEAAVEAARTAKDSQKGRLAFDAERWYLGKMRPMKYGERVNQVHSDPTGQPLPPAQVNVAATVTMDPALAYQLLAAGKDPNEPSGG